MDLTMSTKNGRLSLYDDYQLPGLDKNIRIRILFTH